MNSIELKNFGYSSRWGHLEFFLWGKVAETCSNVNMKLETGNAYCIDTYLSGGGWALSWFLTGNTIFKKFIKMDFDMAFWDGSKMSLDKFKELGCSVGLTGFEGTFSANKPVKKLLQKCIKDSSRVNSVDELVDMFGLSKARYDRSIRCYSNERWRVSIALGYARGARIFGFPWMSPDYMVNFKDPWIKPIVDFLIQNDCLVIIPTIYNDDMSDIFTKLVSFEYSNGGIYGAPIEIRELPGPWGTHAPKIEAWIKAGRP